MESSYRTRIYGAYISTKQKSISSAQLKDLKPRFHFLKRIVRFHFPPDFNASILDLGSGHGALIHVARQQGYCNIKGVDGSTEQVITAKALGIKGVEKADIFKTLIDKPNEALDCVVTLDVIEHFNKNELISLVDAVYRVLKPDGRWIIHAPNAASPFASRIRYGDLTHELSFTQTSLAQLLLSSDFSNLNCYEDRPVPHGVQSSVRYLLWRCIRLALRIYIAVETGDTGRDAIFSQNFLAVAFK
jgi:cyclopropane fatty-acyl-phospholipid synthase-like methyltransferase